LSALAAAIGLFFSATVASSSVDATRRQLDQDERQQAGRVGYWTEPAGELSETIILVNRSLDPVTNIELWWHAPDANIDPAKHEDVFMAFSTIPPCTRMVFDHRAVDEYLLSRFGIEQGGPRCGRSSSSTATGGSGCATRQGSVQRRTKGRMARTSVMRSLLVRSPPSTATNEHYPQGQELRCVRDRAAPVARASPRCTGWRKGVDGEVRQGHHWAYCRDSR
jgi:hypothetical protein